LEKTRPVLAAVFPHRNFYPITAIQRQFQEEEK